MLNYVPSYHYSFIKMQYNIFLNSANLHFQMELRKFLEYFFRILCVNILKKLIISKKKAIKPKNLSI
ncbi:hypothetical protein CAPN005_11070 [Capnocytophaga cynodegmi]|nr:hypothetical protein CAPN005_11070 [Capnocytophaga cynodegmi]